MPKLAGRVFTLLPRVALLGYLSGRIVRVFERGYWKSREERKAEMEVLSFVNECGELGMDPRAERLRTTMMMKELSKRSLG